MLKPTLLMTAITLLTLGNAQASPAHCATLDKQQAHTLFERWNQSLQTGDARQVAAHYAPEAVLLPTVSNTPRLDNAGRIDYFKHFLKNKPVGSIDSSTLISACNSAVDTGTYTFRFNDKSEVNARYTFSYAWIDDKWLITSHHSSAMPE